MLAHILSARLTRWAVGGAVAAITFIVVATLVLAAVNALWGKPFAPPAAPSRQEARPLPSLQPPNVDPALLEPDPMVARMWEIVAELEECAQLHHHPDYGTMAEALRGSLAVASKWPTGDERDILTFQMSNANAMLATCR